MRNRCPILRVIDMKIIIIINYNKRSINLRRMSACILTKIHWLTWLKRTLYTPADDPINCDELKIIDPIDPNTTPQLYTIRMQKWPCSVSRGSAIIIYRIDARLVLEELWFGGDGLTWKFLKMLPASQHSKVNAAS